jgi:monoterpene epsilon-lactone hydrolase
MSSLTGSLIHALLRVQRLAQRRATIDDVRRLSRWTERLYSVPKDIHWVKVSRGEFTYEWLAPEHLATAQVLCHIHGGGFSLPLHSPRRFTIAYLARLVDARTLLIDYRLAPKYPFPAALDDCIEAYHWLITDEDIPPEEVILSGESAGGDLAVITLLALRDAGSPLPSGEVTICPVFDFEGGGTFYTQDDPLVLANFAMLQFKAYQGNADPQTPLLSPLYAEVKGLPPLLIQVGGAELLRSAAEEFAVRAKQAGVQATLRV